MDYRATYSACRGILLACRGIFPLCGGILPLCGGILPLCPGILFVRRGILLDVVTHAAAHRHENEVDWFWRQKRNALSTAFSAQLVNWQYGGNSIGKNGFSVERPGT